MPNFNSSSSRVSGKTVVVPADPEEALAEAFHNNAKAFDRLRRHETTIERSYYKAINELRKLQTERRLQQPPAPPIGSVLQKPVLDHATQCTSSETSKPDSDGTLSTASAAPKTSETILRNQ